MFKLPRCLIVFAALASVCADASAVWLTVGRGLVVRGATRSVASSDMSWLGREIAKAAIEQAVKNASPVQQDVAPSQCLVVEFDGTSNHVANFCNHTIPISQVLVADSFGRPYVSPCSGCSAQPGQILTLRSSAGASIGPVVAIDQEGGGGVPVGTLPPLNRQERFEDLTVKVIRWSYNNQSASVFVEIHNPSPMSVGLVVATRSIWSHAVATVFNRCGGKYEQWNSPYDGFSGISKTPESPTWIPPNGKIRVSLNPNTLVGANQTCPLSHLTVDAYLFRAGVQNGQPTSLLATIE